MSINPKTVRQLKNWYIVDHILLDGDSKKSIKSKKVFEEYVTLKASFLQNLNELYESFKIETKDMATSDKVLQEHALLYSKKCRATSAYMLENNKQVKKHMSQLVITESKRAKNADIKKISKIVTESQFKKLSMDNAFIGMPLLENDISLIPNGFKNEILHEAYKLQRDELLKITMKICMNQ